MNLFSSLEHATQIPWVFSSALFATLLLILIGLRVKSAVAQGGGVVPEEGLSTRNVLKVIVEMLAVAPADRPANMNEVASRLAMTLKDSLYAWDVDDVDAS